MPVLLVFSLFRNSCPVSRILRTIFLLSDSVYLTLCWGLWPICHWDLLRVMSMNVWICLISSTCSHPVWQASLVEGSFVSNLYFCLLYKKLADSFLVLASPSVNKPTSMLPSFLLAQHLLHIVASLKNFLTSVIQGICMLWWIRGSYCLF